MNFNKRLIIKLLIILFLVGCDNSKTTTLYEELNIDIPDTQNIVEETQNIEDNITNMVNTKDDTNITTDITDTINNNENITNSNIDIMDIDDDSQAELIEPYKTPNISETNNQDIKQNNISDNQDIKSNFLKECDQVVDKEFFEVCYSYNLKVAKAVIYRLEGDLVNELNIKERPKFYEEELIPEEYRAEYSDYTNSGYDRGHMAPDASFDWSIESLEATYSMANIIPQVPKVNRYGWANLEQYVRDRAVELGYVDVINVVEYGDDIERIGENRIGVSKGYYKILSNSDENYRECFYYKNEEPQEDSDSVKAHVINCNLVR